eukprot:gene9482-6653_t
MVAQSKLMDAGERQLLSAAASCYSSHLLLLLELSSFFLPFSLLLRFDFQWFDLWVGSVLLLLKDQVFLPAHYTRLLAMTGNPFLNAVVGAVGLCAGVRWYRSSPAEEVPKPVLLEKAGGEKNRPPHMAEMQGGGSQQLPLHSAAHQPAAADVSPPEHVHHHIHVHVVNPEEEVVHKFDQTPCREAASLGLPSDQAVRCYGGYLASLNYERRIPNWVIEALDYNRISRKHKNTDEKHGAASGEEQNVESAATSDPAVPPMPVSRQQSVFFADPTVEEAFRVAPELYEQSGYWGISRGHLAAAQFHTNSQSELDATFNMNANIVPQDMALNALDWFRLEQLTRRLTRKVQKGEHRGEFVDPEAKLYVATGPAFLPTRPKSPDGHLQMIHDVLEVKNQMVAVPTHLYKVLVSERREKPGADPEYTSAAFLMPNQAIPEERRLTDFQVPVATVESLTGLRFFPKVSPASLPDLCHRFKCESPSSPFTQLYRPVAQLRSAMSVPELRSRYNEIVHHAKDHGVKVNSAIEREYQKRMQLLLCFVAFLSFIFFLELYIALMVNRCSHTDKMPLGRLIRSTTLNY